MSEFPSRRFAEQDAPGGAELFRHHRIPCRHVIGQEFRLGCGPDPGRLDDVLEAIRNAVQRAARAIARDFGLGCPGLPLRKLGGEGHKAQ
jgi:hypothetical protein